MNHKEQIEREADSYARNEWGDAYKGILPDDIIQKGEDAYANSFICGANFALEMDRWVKVEDGLPQDKQEVLACYAWGEHTHMNVLYYKGREWYYDDATLISKVTHWMELPKLPQ